MAPPSTPRHGGDVIAATLAICLSTYLAGVLSFLVAMGLFIGYLVRATPSWQGDARLFVAVGLFGGFTTFSSFSLDTIAMLERGEIGQALLYVVVSVGVGIAALYGGLVLVRGAA